MEQLGWLESFESLPAFGRVNRALLVRLTMTRFPELDYPMEAAAFSDWWSQPRRRLKAFLPAWFNWLRRASAKNEHVPPVHWIGAAEYAEQHGREISEGSCNEAREGVG